MNKLFNKILAAICLTFVATACMNDEDPYADYADWREFNQSWLVEQTTRTNPDGTSYYTRCAMPTDPQAYVLMHTVGEVHTENLKPLFTSTTKVNYTLKLANDSVVDQGTDFVSQLSSQSYITGWSISIMQLHVGDSAQFVLPYAVGYGESGNGLAVPPYSNLMFDIRLVNIEAYELRP